MSVNAAVAGDISIALGDALSEAIVISFQACDDSNEPLSLAQKRQIISACMVVVLDSKQKVECILDLDDIARGCAEEPNRLAELFEDVGIEIDFDSDKIGFDD